VVSLSNHGWRARPSFDELRTRIVVVEDGLDPMTTSAQWRAGRTTAMPSCCEDAAAQL